mmetsp:Transcript_96220/g.176252  ORF Transcript_96220/g.176252 Transcript_96220/m.176252 type:complete len:290 (-) Transcript_96220:53-922(-)
MSMHIIPSDFADQFVGGLHFIELSRFEAVSKSTQALVVRSKAWERCACHELPMFLMSSLQQGSAVSQECFKQLLAKLRRVPVVTSYPVPLLNARFAQSLATSVGRARNYASAHVAAGNGAAATFVGMFDFSDQGLVSPRHLGLRASGESNDLVPWSLSSPLRISWNLPGQQTRMAIRLGMYNKTMLLSAESQEVNTLQGTVTFPSNSAYVVDVHAVSEAMILRMNYSMHRTTGKWISGTGLCSLLGSRQELLKGLVCVVYIRDATIHAMSSESRTTAHALNVDIPRRQR